MEIVREFFEDVMAGFFEAVALSDSNSNSTGNSDQNNLENIQYVILHLEEFPIIFESLSLKTRYTLLDHFLLHPQYLAKLVSTVEAQSDQEYLLLEDWLICNTKRVLFEYFSKRAACDCGVLLFLVQSVARLFVKKEGNYAEEVRIVTSFVTQAATLVSQPAATIQLTVNKQNQHTSNNSKNWEQVLGEFITTEPFMCLVISAI